MEKYMSSATITTFYCTLISNKERIRNKQAHKSIQWRLG